MKKLLLFLAFLPFLCLGQKVDTVITTPIYKSYFSYQTHTPLFVVYKLYQGGGNCSRKGMSFTQGGLKQSASNKDYKDSGYEKGHMANAEDFAYDCELERITFLYSNALPQTERLNTGIWKTVETKVRTQSRKDSLLIVCGGFGFERKIGKVGVPNYCYKFIGSLSSGKFVAYLFPNDDSNTYKILTINALIDLIPNPERKIIENIIKSKAL
jgi:endonuclease G, mitochondrial